MDEVLSEMIKTTGFLDEGIVFEAPDLIPEQQWTTLAAGVRTVLGRKFADWVKENTDVVEALGRNTKNHQMYRKVA